MYVLNLRWPPQSLEMLGIRRSCSSSVFGNCSLGVRLAGGEPGNCPVWDCLRGFGFGTTFSGFSTLLSYIFRTHVLCGQLTVSFRTRWFESFCSRLISLSQLPGHGAGGSIPECRGGLEPHELVNFWFFIPKFFSELTWTAAVGHGYRFICYFV